MHAHVFCILIALAVDAHESSVPYLQDVFLKPNGQENANSTAMLDGTCDECLCKVFSDNVTIDAVALNCFPNNTCQLFSTLPVSYKLQASAGAQLHFLKGIFPSPSRCCMRNITELIDRLRNTTPIQVPLSFEATAFGYDEANPNEAVVIGVGSGNLYWFNPIDMSFIQNQAVSTSLTVTLHNHSIFTGRDGTPVVYMLDARTLNQSAAISYSSFNQVRKFIFLNSSQTIAVPTQTSHSVTFIDIQSPTQYTVQVGIASTLPFIIPIAAGDSLLIVKSSRCGESQRHILLRLVMG